MVTPAQLPDTITLQKGVSFDLPMRIAGSDGSILNWTGKEVRFQVANRTDPNKSDCCTDLSLDISSADSNSQIDLSSFAMDGNSPATMGNFRLTIPAEAPDSDTGNSAGIALTSQLDCQDTTFRIVLVTPSGDPDISDTIEPLVLGRISIVGL